MAYRIPTTELSLPYGDNDLRVPVNGIHTNTVFNDKVDLLISNFDYLLNSASIINNTSPQSYTYAYDFDGSTWTNTPSSFVDTPPIDHDYNFVEVVEMYNGKFLYICAKTESIDFYIGGDISEDDDTALQLKIKYDQIKQNGNQKYKNISYVRYDAEKLYVYDSAYNALVVYDIAALLYSDIVVDNIKFVRQLSQVKNLIALDFSANIYAVTDTELIMFNRDLNILSSVSLDASSPKRVLVGDDIYVLYSDKIDYYNLSLSFIKSVQFESFNSDVLIDIEASKVDSDVFYILSKEYVYRYDIIDNTILNYIKLGIDRDKDYVDLYVKDGGDKDQIFLTDENKLHFMEDFISFVYLYDRNNLLDRQTSADIQINDLELEQDFVFNASIQRILFNNLLLYNSLIYKAVATTDSIGFLEYSHKINLVNSEEINPDIILIGQNEVFSYQVFQRTFNEILKIQNKILELISYKFTENSTNTLSI